jgi:hypothetical protein
LSPAFDHFFNFLHWSTRYLNEQKLEIARREELSSISDEETQDKAAPKGSTSDIDVMGMCEQLNDLQLHLDQNGVPDAANTIEWARHQIMGASRKIRRNACTFPSRVKTYGCVSQEKEQLDN